MSVYVNLGLVADSRKDSAILESRTKGGDILVDPSQYSVGVNRFKIPLGEIPLFRVYSGDYHLGFCANSPSMFNGNALVNHMRRINHIEYKTNYMGLIDNSPVDSNTDQQIFNGCFKNMGVDQFNGKQYKDFYSHQEYADFLNMALMRSFNNTFEMESDSATLTLTNSSAVVLNTDTTDSANKVNGGNAVKELNGKIAVAASTFARAATNTSLVSNHSYITSIELVLEDLQGVSGYANGTPDFSHLSCWLRREPVDSGGSKISAESISRKNAGDYDEWCLFSNMLEGLSDGTGNADILIGTEGGMATTRDNKNAKNYLRYKGNGGTLYMIALDYVVAKDIIGKRADGYHYELFFVNHADYLTRTGATEGEVSHFECGANDIGLSIQYSNITSVREIEPISGNATGIGHNPDDTLGTLDKDRKLVPYFSYNDDTNKFEYNISNHYILGMGLQLVMNKKLSQQFSFGNYIVDEIKNKTDFSKYVFSIATFDEDTDAGVVIVPPTSYGAMGVGRNDKQEWWSMVANPEEQDTRFKRDWLNSIVITTGGLAIDGEIVGDGSQTRKILTDFQIDPTSTGRDYLIFTNSGGMRLYEIRSSEPLKDIDARIQFQDTKGQLRPLIVGFNEECNMKLEFRPNSQIYSLTQDISSFEF